MRHCVVVVSVFLFSTAPFVYLTHVCVRSCGSHSTVVLEMSVDGQKPFVSDPVPVSDQVLTWNYAVAFGIE